VLALNSQTLYGSTYASALKVALHELNHARHANILGLSKYLQMYEGSASSLYRIESLVELRALRQVERILGGVSPQLRNASSAYLEQLLP
jgi:hypothetical protein